LLTQHCNATQFKLGIKRLQVSSLHILKNPTQDAQVITVINPIFSQVLVYSEGKKRGNLNLATTIQKKKQDRVQPRPKKPSWASQPLSYGTYNTVGSIIPYILTFHTKTNGPGNMFVIFDFRHSYRPVFACHGSEEPAATEST
jgi:hypothetical protein